MECPFPTEHRRQQRARDRHQTSHTRLPWAGTRRGENETKKRIFECVRGRTEDDDYVLFSLGCCGTHVDAEDLRGVSRREEDSPVRCSGTSSKGLLAPATAISAPRAAAAAAAPAAAATATTNTTTAATAAAEVSSNVLHGAEPSPRSRHRGREGASRAVVMRRTELLLLSAGGRRRGHRRSRCGRGRHRFPGIQRPPRLRLAAATTGQSGLLRRSYLHRESRHPPSERRASTSLLRLIFLVLRLLLLHAIDYCLFLLLLSLFN